jgi:hypothetical protein
MAPALKRIENANIEPGYFAVRFLYNQLRRGFISNNVMMKYKG